MRKEVSQISKPKPRKVKRMNLNVRAELHDSFKAVTAGQGLNMTNVLLEFIQTYVDRYSSKPKPKGRRK